MKTETSADRIQALKELGFSIETKTPRGEVHDPNWPAITFPVRVFFKGKVIYDKTYSLGVGHVNPAAPNRLSGFTEDERAMVMTWARNRSTNFKNKELLASTATKLAILQDIKPELDDVLYSLMSDGECFFNAQDFEEWAKDLGYDPDSRKAEAIYRECDSIGRRLALVVPAEVLVKVREIVADM